MRATAPERANRTAVVFQRPLPYLYLARSVFADARQPYQALDSLPLAAEPFAAALDVIFAFLIAAANRASTIDLLGSPHWQFPSLPGPATSVRERVSALDARLREVKYFGGWDRLRALAGHEAFATGDNPTDNTKPRTSTAPRAGAGGRGARRSDCRCRRLASGDRGADGFGTARSATRFHSSPRTHPGGRNAVGIASPAGTCRCDRRARVAGRRTGTSR